MPNVLIAGGGSGGHVAPAIAIAEALRIRSCDVLDRALNSGNRSENGE